MPLQIENESQFIDTLANRDMVIKKLTAILQNQFFCKVLIINCDLVLEILLGPISLILTPK